MKDSLGVHEGDGDHLVLVFADDDITWQQEADVRLDIQCLVGQRRVAGAEYAIGPLLDPELRLQRRSLRRPADRPGLPT